MPRVYRLPFSLQQAEDTELKQFLNNPITSSLILKQIDVPNIDITIYCDINQPKARPFIFASGRMSIFKKFQNLVHPGVRTTQKLISPCIKTSLNGQELASGVKKLKFNGILKALYRSFKY